MGRAPLSTSCRVEDGKLYVRNKRRLDEAVARLQDGEYFLSLERVQSRISDAQRAYYFGVVIARLAVKLKQNVKLTHELLKAQFLPIDKARTGENGTLINGLVIGGSLARLNKLETIEYLERIVDHAAENWDCYIPPPDPLWREHAESEQPQQEVA